MHRIVFCFFLVFNLAIGQNPEIVKQYDNLSPTAKLFLEYGDDNKLFPFVTNGRVDALIQFKTNAKWPDTIYFYSRYGNIHSAKLTRLEIQNLSMHPSVEYIDVNCRLNSPRLRNDTSRILSKVDLVENGIANGLSADFTGKGVIVGVVDIGFQTDNPTFFTDKDTNYKVFSYWHQNEKAGTPPSGFTYGSEFTTPASILSTRDDDGTHGTHVAGIAAGSGLTSPDLKYRGMAPGSDLVFVTIKYGNDTLGGSALGDFVVANSSILDAYKYIFKKATTVGKPAVINLSWGMHTGPHDGSSLFDKAVEALTGPGKIIVGSAGNEAGNQIHISTNISGDTAYTFAIDRSRNDYAHENVYCDFWGDSAQSFGLNISLFDTLGNQLLESPFYYSTLNKSLKTILSNGKDTIWFTLIANKRYINNDKPEIIFIAETNHAKNQRIRLGITGNGTVHGWNSGQSRRWTSGSFLSKVKGNDYSGKYLNGNAKNTVGENGGTGKATITAGAYIARNSWTDMNGVFRSQNWLNTGEIAGFSSHGPTVDNRIKPDICSPGQNIASAANYRTYAPWMSETTPLKTHFRGNDQYWVLFSGTSMAAPHLAGIVALLLEADSTLTPAEVRSILQKTVTRDLFTGPDSNNVYGYGKVNAFAAIQRTITLNTTKSDVVKQQVKVYPNPAIGLVWFASSDFYNKVVTVEIKDICGKAVATQVSNETIDGLIELNINSLPMGVYIWNTRANGNSQSGKLIIKR